MSKQIVCSKCLSNVDAQYTECPYCGQSFENTNPSGTLPVNTLLAGRYTIGHVLELDGEGVLYAAVDNTSTRRVVIKEYVPVTICAARTADGSVIPREGRELMFKTTRMDFEDLYRLLITLGRDDGLVQVLDLVEANNTAYAVREPDEGIPIYRYMEQRGRPFTLQETVTLLRPVVYGVDAMHRMGILHRGISPETVRITASGAKLSGYATLGMRTADSEMKNHVYDGFAAPEQYAASEFDGKYTDIYALGAMFYWMLTGKTPVPANLRRMNDTLVPAHTQVPEIPGFVSAALSRAMRMAPGERMQAAPDLLTAVTVPAQEPETEHKPVDQSRNIKLIILAAAFGLLLFLLLCAAMMASVKDNKPSESELQPESQAASSENESHPVAEAAFVVPRLVGRRYEDVIADTDYTDYINFMIVDYEFSTDFAVGEIIRQDPEPGKEVKPGTIIKVIVSDGPETAVMPPVIGRPQDDVMNDLTNLKIKYAMYPMVNDGSYMEGTVAKCDTEEGSVVEIGRQSVILYIAGAAPVQPETPPLPDSSASSEVPPAPSEPQPEQPPQSQPEQTPEAPAA